MSLDIRHLTPDDVPLMKAMLTVFGNAFNDADTYTANHPSEGYFRKLLADNSFIALAAMKSDVVVGGITAYELQKFEQECSEIYIYDLAVESDHRREGIATALIKKMKAIAARRGAYVLIIQADTNVEDEPAIALYTKLGKRAEVLHFDIPVEVDDSA